MAFQLTSRKSIARQLRRVVRRQFRTALHALDGSKPNEEAIHEARKSLKRIRAVLRLVRDELGSAYRSENERLRRVARRLSSLRDADATTETLEALHGRYPTIVTPAVARAVAPGLRLRKHQARNRAGGLVVRAARQLRRSSKSTPDRIERVGDFAAVRAGMTRGYRRAQRGMKALCLDSDATRFHSWRRRLKDHLYQMRLFEALHATARTRVRRAEQLQRWLGDDHNLAMLRTTVLSAPDGFGNARTTALVLGCITKYQAWLRQRALKAGHRLFDEKPRKFGETVTAWRRELSR